MHKKHSDEDTPLTVDKVKSLVIEQGNQELPTKTINRSNETFMVWLLAFAPILGTIILIVATETSIYLLKYTPKYYAEMWWIIVGVNIIIPYFDFIKLEKSPNSGDSLKTWQCLITPLYIYHREKMINEQLRKFWV